MYDSVNKVMINRKDIYSIPELTSMYCQWRTQEFFFGGGGSNSVEDRGQRERGSWGVAPSQGFWKQL